MEYGPVANGEVPVEKEPEMGDAAALNKQVELLSNDLDLARATIRGLEDQIDSLAKERSDMSSRIEKLQTEVSSMSPVVVRAADLEGQVSRLQHDLVSATSEGEDVAEEAKQLKLAVEVMEKEKAALGDAIRALEENVESLVAQKGVADAAVSERDGRIRELEALVKGLEEEMKGWVAKRDVDVAMLAESVKKASVNLEEKNLVIAELKKAAALATAEVDVLRGSVEELESSVADGEGCREIRSGAVDADEGMDLIGHLKNPWTVAALSTGTIVVATATLYLYCSKKR